MQEKLNQFHIILFTYMAQSGVVMFRLPRIVAENFGTNGWISILVCFVISSFNILLIHFVYKHGQGQSVFQLLEQRSPLDIVSIVCGVRLIANQSIDYLHIVFLGCGNYVKENDAENKNRMDRFIPGHL